jgi:hypothetical protein
MNDMKITVQRRLALLAALLILALVLFAAGIQAAQAANAAGTGAGSGTSTIDTPQLPTLAQVQQHQGIGPYASGTAPQLPTLAQVQQHQGIGPYASGTTASAGTQGRGGVGPLAAASVAQPASAVTLSTSARIAIGSALAALIVGITAWALLRRRRQPGESVSATYCAQHPEDSLCGAA